MGDIFLKLLNISITASWLILAVLCVRFLFRKMPRWIHCVLWGVVAVRLVVPFSIESTFSLQPSAEPIRSSTIVEGEILPYVPSIDSNLAIVEDTVNPMLAGTFAYQESESVAPLQVMAEIAGVVWLCGMIVLLVFAIGSMVRLLFLVREAVPYKDGVFLCDAVKSPFILGVLKPRIYLSSALSEEEMGFVLAHEKAHLRRKDHLWKPFGYLILSVYWFNPLCWAAYLYLCKDIELACDEKVIKDMSFADKKEYSKVLLSCAVQRRLVFVCPLAFGEVEVKERVKSVLKYKKPAFLVTITAIVVCVVVAVCFLTNPSKEDAEFDNSDGAQGAINEYLVTDQPQENIILQDLAYYLELSVSNLEFQDMPEAKKTALLMEYGTLLDGYTLIARESADGKTSYIVGHFNGDTMNSPLYKMQYMSHTSDKQYQILYLEENDEAVDKIMYEQGVQAITDEGYVIEDSYISWPVGAEYIFLQPVDVKQELYSAFARYLDPARGSRYIEDALSRGIAVNEVEEPYLSIYLISEEYGEITENIPLTEEVASAILTEATRKIADGFGFGAALRINGEYYYYSENKVPQSVLNLAVEKCGYQFASPESITAPITEACFECSWLDEPLYLEEAYLSRLEEILKSAEYTGGGNCGYGAKLTLTLENGENVTIFKGTDDCGSLVFGSWGGYSISDKADDEFWEMFGLNPDGHPRLFLQEEDTKNLGQDKGKKAAGSEVVDVSEICSIVVNNGNTGERKTLTMDDYSYRDLIKLYRQLDFMVEYEENTRCGYQYSMILQDTDGNTLQMVTPYKDGAAVDSIFYKYDNTGNGAAASLRLMEYLEYVFYPERSTMGKPLTEVPVNTLENVTMSMEKYKPWEGEIEIINQTDSELQTWQWYEIQKLEDGAWQQVEQQTERMLEDIAYRLPAGETTVLPTNWKTFYGELPSGEYRIIKEVYVSLADRIDSYYLAAEFDIP